MSVDIVCRLGLLFFKYAVSLAATYRIITRQTIGYFMQGNAQTKEEWSRLESMFSFARPDAQNLITCFHKEMKRGLAGQTSSLKMIPCYVSRPTGLEEGSFLALDLGGTNLRVLAVELDGRGGANISAVSRFVIPASVMHGGGEGLFDFLAEGVTLFLEEHGYNLQQHQDLAFTFSFPVEQSALNAGILLNWTKDFTASEVEGKDVVALLTEALGRRNIKNISVTALANDTIGTLMTKSYADASCDMGVILGTGTNACYPENTRRIAKYSGSDDEREMIVNLEWGNFGKVEMNRYDRALDRTTRNVGRQRMEKMVSGMYLGELARLVILDMIDRGCLLQKKDRLFFDREHTVRTEHLSQAAGGEDIFAQFGLVNATDRDREAALRISHIVSMRAARIAGTAIAAVITWMDAGLERSHTVAVDGSLFEKYPGFRTNILNILQELFGDSAEKIALSTAADGSGIGAAIIAAVASGRRRQ
jgi:hexokinase